MTAPSPPWALALHGGAGVMPGRSYARAERALAELVLDGERRLSGGDGALEVVIDLVAAMEASGLFVAGCGSGRNSLGEVELDASVMDGETGRCGAVAALQTIRSAIRTADAVMRESSHVLLVGPGAARFALQTGQEPIGDLDAWLTAPDGYDPADAAQSHGTVGAVALDLAGRLAAATSTGGVYNALPGRVGDSAVIGAGTWADGTVAVSCTGEGEAFIRACAAHDIAKAVAAGKPPQTAARETLARVLECGGGGGLILVTAKGEVTMAFNTAGMKRASASHLCSADVGVDGALQPARRLNEKRTLP